MVGTAITTTQPRSKSALVAEQRAQHPGAAATTHAAAPGRFTEREKQVARLAALGLSYDGICRALKAQGVFVSVSRARKLIAGIASRLANPNYIAPQMLVVLWAARRIWEREQREAQASRGASAP
jgi:hypothetical protein